MASVRPTANGKFELTIRNKKHLGPGRRVYLTFDSEEEAASYGERTEKLLAAGIVPAGLLQPEHKPSERLARIIGDYLNTGKPAPTDIHILERLRDEVGQTPLTDFTYAWCETWVAGMKLKQNLAPSTMRKRIGSLNRCLDWYMRSFPGAMVGNPLRLLPRGTSTYTAQDARQAEALGLAVKVDVERDRRLAGDEEARIVAALSGQRRPDRERALAEDAGLIMLFWLILDTGLRLREAYTLTRQQIVLERRVIRVRSSKQWHGRIKYRDVPLKPALHARMTAYLATRELGPGDMAFPWWNGAPETLASVTAKLSGAFGRLFRYADCADLTEHDLRHEATCRWYEMRRPDGQWVFRDAEIHKIMGWAPGSRMGMRYASFRAEDLADRMWPAEAAAIDDDQ